MNRRVRANHPISGIEQGDIFTALLDVKSFPEWGLGLRRSQSLDNSVTVAQQIGPGTSLEFVLSAAGLTHRVVGEVTEVEAPNRIEWRYTKGAVGNGGWFLEGSGGPTVTLSFYTDYLVEPAWLDRIARRPFFRRLTENLLRRSLRRFEKYLREKQPPTTRRR